MEGRNVQSLSDRSMHERRSGTFAIRQRSELSIPSGTWTVGGRRNDRPV